LSHVDVCIVGGGPAGTTLAALLARAGHEVLVLERAPTWRWRACGVFSSPAATTALARLGLDDSSVRDAARPIPAMRLEVPRAPSVRLTYGDDGSLTRPAVAFDRAVLDESLLEMATGAGARVERGVAATGVDVTAHGPGRVMVRGQGGGERAIEARVVVGADGIRSLVARRAGVARPARLGHRVGLTFHVRDPRPETPRDARMVVLDGAYCGLAPVPGGRVNVGIVLTGRRWLGLLARQGATATARHVLGSIPPTDGEPDWATAEACERPAGAAPLGHRVFRRAGRGWLLVGDAAGFLDPFTGEGLHRALVSAELAASAIDARLRHGSPLTVYERRMTARFMAKDAVTLLVQGFLARPALLRHATRRLASRDAVRETMALVIGDLAPASRAFDPRFLARLLAP
jgi:flavin-dependent dehydrogenase